MIKLVEITKKFNLKLNKEKKVLENLSLEIKYNQLTAIVGESGSGKSTLLNIIGGLLKADKGSIVFNDVKINKRNIDNYRKKIVSYIFQDFNLMPNLTVYDNLILPLKINGESENKERNLSLLKRLNILDNVNQMVYELSSGEKQRVAIARALICNSEIILADEPTGNLDEENSNNIFEILKDISKEKIVIISTHDKVLANKYADRIIELKDGKIISDNEISKQIEVRKNTKTILNNKVRINPFFYFKNQVNLRRIVTIPFIFTILFFTLIMSSSSLFLSLLNEEKSELLINTFYDNNENIVLISNEKSPGNFYLSNNEIGIITNKFKDNIFLKGKKIDNINYCFNDKFCSVAEYNEEFNNKLNYSFLEGRAPNKEDEGVITKYIFDELVKLNMKLDNITIKNYSDIINKKIMIFDDEILITGIIDTKLNESRYNNSKSNVIGKEEYWLQRQSINSFIMLHSDFFLNKIKFLDSKNINHGDDRIDFFSNKKVLDYSSFNVKRNFNLDGNLEIVSNKSKLEYDELILPYSFLFNYNGGVDKYWKLSFINLFEQNKHSINENLNESFVDHDQYESYLIENQNIKVFNTTLNYFEFIENKKIDYYKETFEELNKNFKLKMIIEGKEYSKNLKVVGSTFSLDDNTLYLSEETVDEIINYYDINMYQYLFSSLTGIKNKDIDFYNSLKDSYDLSNIVIVNYNFIDNKIDIIKSLYKIYLILLVLFSIYLGYLTTNNSIKKQEKELRVFRSLGINKVEFFLITLFKHLIPIVIIFSLTNLLVLSATTFLNNLFITKYYFLFKIFIFTIKNVLLVLSSLILVFFLGNFLSMKHYYKKEEY